MEAFVALVTEDQLQEQLRRAIAALERELQTLPCRRDRKRLEELLHDDFREIGRSGRSWNRDDIVAHLLTADDDSTIHVNDLAVRLIGDDAALATWTSRRGDKRTARSSLWVHGGETWQLLYHQGTPLTD